MVWECEKFVKTRNLKFSTNIDPQKCKTKCIIFSKKTIDRQNVKSIELNGTPLKWVPTIKYLGSVLQEDNSMSIDTDRKRVSFIGKVHSLTQEFFFLAPAVKMKLFEIYTESFYGSSIWNLFGSSCDKIYRAYNVTIRQTFQVPRETHRYLVEPISESLHPKVFLSSRLVKFASSLNDCNKVSLRILANLYQHDLRTVLGKNLFEISRICNISKDNLTPSAVKNGMRYFKPPENEEWRGSAVHDLINVQNNYMTLEGFDEHEINEMINFLCTT